MTGQAPWEVVQREVLQPAQLRSSGYFYLDQLPVWAAPGYTTTSAGRLVENIYALAGAEEKPQLFARRHDLARLWQLLAAGEFLPLEGGKEAAGPLPC